MADYEAQCGDAGLSRTKENLVIFVIDIHVFSTSIALVESGLWW